MFQLSFDVSEDALFNGNSWIYNEVSEFSWHFRGVSVQFQRAFNEKSLEILVAFRKVSEGF